MTETLMVGKLPHILALVLFRGKRFLSLFSFLENISYKVEEFRNFFKPFFTQKNQNEKKF